MRVLQTFPVLLFVVGGCVGANDSSLFVNLDELELGDVWETAEYEHSFGVVNTSSELIHVRSIVSSCGCTSVEPEAFSIEPNAMQIVRVKLDLQSKRSERDVRSVLVNLSAITDDSAPVIWAIRGTVQRLLADAPARIDLPAASVGRTAAAQYFDIKTRFPVEEMSVSTTGGAPLTVAITAVDSRLYRLTVKQEASGRVGRFEGAINLSARVGDSTSVKSIVITGAIEGPVVPVPSILHLGAGRVGDELLGEIALVGSVHIEGVEFANVPTSTLVEWDQDKQMLMVRQSVHRPGFCHEEILCVTRSGTEKCATQTPVTIQYYGISE